MKFPKNPENPNRVDDRTSEHFMLSNLKNALSNRDLTAEEKGLMKKNGWSREDILILREMEKLNLGKLRNPTFPDNPQNGWWVP
jgi:hypothetical protein